MKVLVNGENRELSATLTLSQLLDQLGLAGKRIAVEINENIIPKSQHPETTLKEDDKVEIIHAIGGG